VSNNLYSFFPASGPEFTTVSSDKGLESFKKALTEVSEEPGSTVHYSVDGSPAPQIDDQNIGTRAKELEGRDLFIAPSPSGFHADIVERIDMHGSAIDPSLTKGFGAHEGPVRSEAEEKKKT
jgi:hypothetical protein